MPLSSAEKQRRYRERKRREVEERKRWARKLPPVAVAEREADVGHKARQRSHLRERAALKAAEEAACAEVGVSFDVWEMSVLEQPEPEWATRVCELLREAGWDPDGRVHLGGSWHPTPEDVYAAELDHEAEREEA